MPDDNNTGFGWLTQVSKYDTAGYVYETTLPLWTCEICGAVVGDNGTDKHREFHARS